MAGRDGALTAYTWEAAARAVTGKPVSSSGNRCYIPGPNGTLAVCTYSIPTRGYDPAGAQDFASDFAQTK